MRVALFITCLADGVVPDVAKAQCVSFAGSLPLTDQDLFDATVIRYPEWVSRQQFLILG